MNKTDAINCIQDIIDVANSHVSACVYSRNGGVAQLENVLECLKNSEPVVHAHWVIDESGYDGQCSKCGSHPLVDNNGDYPVFSKCCPNCGAVMDEEDSENGN